jgi:hypothetical protein
MNNEPQQEKRPDVLDPKANLKALGRIIVLVLVLGGSIWLFVRWKFGNRFANAATAIVLRQPIDLGNVVENLPANSWKALSLPVPYAGFITIEVSVARGNEINVRVVKADQLENLKNKKQFAQFETFSAEKTRLYKRTARLEPGNYALILHDGTLGILSSQSSDIRVHMRIDP